MDIQNVKTYGDYEIVCTLGKGSFGKVKLGKRGDQLVAIKLSKIAPKQIMEQNDQLLLKEIQTLKKLNHPYLLKYIDSHTDWKYTKTNGEQTQRLGLIIEYLPSNQLMEILQGGPLGSELSRYYFKQLLEALDYLHNNSVVHRDLKPQNILFDADFNLKITDFGLAAVVDKIHPTTVCGTGSYKSPEMLLRVPYNGILNDLFAAGVILFNMMTAKSPFEMANPMVGLYRCLATNQHQKFWTTFEKLMGFDADFKDLINSMLSLDPTQRLSICQIKSHPWYAKDSGTTNGTLAVELQTFKDKVNRVNNRKSQTRARRLRTKKQSKTVHPLFGQTNFRNMEIECEKAPVLTKKAFNSFGIKSTDIFIEAIKDPKAYLKLIMQISSNIRVGSGDKFEIQVQKLHQSQKFVGLLSVLSVDEKTDCLRLKCLQGNIEFYYEFLRDLNMLFEQS